MSEVVYTSKVRIERVRGLAPEQRDAAVRAHATHADFCPVARTLKGCVQITTELHMEDL